MLSKRREGKVPLAKSVGFEVQTTRVEEIRLSYSSESEVKESREALPRSFYILTLGRGEAVTQRTLTPLFVGSNPTTPAIIVSFTVPYMEVKIR